MTKLQFLFALRDALAELPRDELEQRLHFYSEMIEDRMEEGLSEEEAVSAVGSVEEILLQLVGETSPAILPKNRAKSSKRMKAWEVVLLVLGSPLWLSLLLAAFAVVFSLYVSFCAVTISLWAVFVAVLACALGGVAAGVIFACNHNVLAGIAMVGAGIFCIGLSIFLFYGCKAATKGALLLPKQLVLWIKSCFTKKEVL